MSTNGNGMHAILDNAEWLLVGFDEQTQRFRFVQTTRDIVTNSTFIDGRTPLSTTGASAGVDFDEAADWHARRAHEPNRLIAHSAFCGSTLLARMIAANPSCLVYKEPIILNELSAAKPRLAANAARWRMLCDITASQFRKGFSVGEVGVLKPPNWPVNVLEDLCLRDDARAVFVTMDAPAFLGAVVRGGPDRMKFMLDFTSHLGEDHEEVRALIARVQGDQTMTSPQRLLTFCMVALRFQQQTFARLSKAMGPERSAIVYYADLTSAPMKALSKTRKVLATPTAAQADNAAVDAVLSRHAKVPTTAFDKAQHDREQAQARQRFGPDIERALAWARGNLGPA